MAKFSCVNSCSKEQGICNLIIQEKVCFVCDVIHRKYFFLIMSGLIPEF